ncbi:MAG: cobalt ECF transporter T component CbiQ [Magnetovibrionaceae bacterium]
MSTIVAAGAQPASTLLDRLDARCRLGALVAFALVTVALSDLAVLSLAFGLSILLCTLARLHPGFVLKRMAALDGLVLIVVLLVPFTTPGEPALSILGQEASREGLVRAADIALTANTVLMALLALLGRMSLPSLSAGLIGLKVPERLVHLLLMTLRYVDVLGDEYRRLRTAMKARGFKPGTNRHSYATLGNLIGMMLVRAIERAERVLGAMKCRGYSGRMPMLAEPKLTRLDIEFLVLCSAVLCVLLGLEVAS